MQTGDFDVCCNYFQPPARMVPRTIENTREPDETIAQPDDEEVIYTKMSL
jgi:hypothetical protein